MKAGTIRVGLLLVTWSISGVSSANTSSDDLATILKAHSSALGLIQRLDVTIKFSSDQKSTDFIPGRNTHTFRWSKSGEIERIRFLYDDRLRDSKKGKSDGIGDLYLDNKVQKELLNWNPKKPPKLRPSQQNGVFAIMQPRRSELPGAFVDPAVTVLFRFQLDGSKTPRTLLDVVRKAKNATVKGRQQLDGHEVWLIHIEHPEFDGSAGYQDIFIDTKTFLALKVDSFFRSLGDKNIIFKNEKVVKAMKHFGDGVSFPVEVEEKLYLQSATRPEPPIIHRGIAEGLTVNQTLPHDALDFRFPKYALVRTLPTVQGKPVVKLWGEDDKPLMIIQNGEQLLRFESQDVARPAGGRRNLYLIIFNAVAIGIIAAIYFWRRMMRRRLNRTTRLHESGPG